MSNEKKFIPPQCIREQPKISNFNNLTDEQVETAKKELINTSYVDSGFPKMLKQRIDPPIQGQTYYIFNFVPSKKAIPDPDGCFGVMKFRGAFPTENDAVEHCETIVRNYDTYSENIIGWVGREFPLTTENKFCSNVKEIDTRTEKMNAIQREDIRSKREQEKKDMKEIQERQEALLKDTSAEQKFDDIDYYIQLKVKIANAKMLQDECAKKMKDATRVIKDTNTRLQDLEERFPEFKKQYLEKYKTATEAVGIQEAETSKMIQYMK